MCTNNYTENIVALEPLGEKFSSFGWDVRNINGNSVSELYDSLSGVRERNNGKPLAIIAKTNKGHGIASALTRTDLHGEAPSGEEAKQFERDLYAFSAEHIENGGYNNGN